MRAAILMFAFDVLGAGSARSAAFPDNPASLAVSRRLGYLPDGTEIRERHGERVRQVRLLLTAHRFAEHRPPWRPEVTGAAACLGLLGAG
jgi:RimJ/RimL family protein N-acetyltransferase